MNLDYSEEGKLKVDMRKYIEELIHDFHKKSKGTQKLRGLKKCLHQKKVMRYWKKNERKYFILML